MKQTRYAFWFLGTVALGIAALMGFNWLLFIGVFAASWLGLLLPHGWCQNKDWSDYDCMAVVGTARMMQGCSTFFVCVQQGCGCRLFYYVLDDSQRILKHHGPVQW